VSAAEALLGHYFGSSSRYYVLSIPPGAVPAPLSPLTIARDIVGGPGADLFRPVVDDSRRIVYLGALRGKMAVAALPD